MRNAGDIKAMGLAECGNLEEGSKATATARVGLKHIDGPAIDHPPEIVGIVTILPRGNFHAGRSTIAQDPETCKIVRRDRFFEPGDT